MHLNEVFYVRFRKYFWESMPLAEHFRNKRPQDVYYKICKNLRINLRVFDFIDIYIYKQQQQQLRTLYEPRNGSYKSVWSCCCCCFFLLYNDKVAKI